MSLGICTTTSEGIVLAADSRQSYRNRKGAWRIGSESASKLFALNSRAGMVIAGPAFLEEKGVGKNISKFIEDFRETRDIEIMEVGKITSELAEFFHSRYDYKSRFDQLEPMIRADIERQGGSVKGVSKDKAHIEFTFIGPDGKEGSGIAAVDQLEFIVAGYNPDASYEVHIVYIPGDVTKKRGSDMKGNEYGADWIGQTDVLSRTVLGFDPRIQHLPIFQNSLMQQGEEAIRRQLAGLEYVIQWGTMTLQDGVDFSILGVETTKAMQRFSDGIKLNPGDVPGVGGPVDVAVITPTGFEYVIKKTIEPESTV